MAKIKSEKEEENNMDFETFKENLANDVKEQFYERYGKEVAVENHKVDKMNA